jgi:hypothetical protein
MVEIVELDMSRNELSGSIPSSFWHLHRLEALLLNDSHVNGTLPTDLGSLVELRRLEADA